MLDDRPRARRAARTRRPGSAPRSRSPASRSVGSSISKTPPICSFVSANGPSVTMRLAVADADGLGGRRARRARSRRPQGAARAELAEERLPLRHLLGPRCGRLLRRQLPPRRRRRRRGSSGSRSWSASSTIEPSLAVRASRRASCRSISASRPSASGSSGISTASSFASRIASSQSSSRTASRPRARRVALVEDEVEDGEHRAQPLRQQVVGRDAEGDAGVADLPLRADEPLRHRRLGDEERVRDLRRRQAGDLPQRQRDPRLGGERRVAAGEDEREAVVGDRAHVVLLGRQRLEPRQQLGLAGEGLLAPDPVDRAVARGVTIQAPGLSGVPSRGQRSNAVVNASCTASSASCMSPRTRVRAATARPHSSRKTAATVVNAR